MKCENCEIKLTFFEWAEHLPKKDLRGYDENSNCKSCGKSTAENIIDRLKN